MKKYTFRIITTFLFVCFTLSLNAQIALKGDLNGNWFNSSTGDWEIGLYDSVAVYKSQIWTYDAAQLKKNKGTLLLSQHNSSVKLYVKLAKNGTLQLGEQPKLLMACTKTPTYRKPVDDKPYEAPIFKMDSVTYSGYIKGYNPKTGTKTLNVRLYDIVCKDYIMQLVNVSENGYFNIKMAIYHPMSVLVSSTGFNGYVFLEPGKNLFQVIDEDEEAKAPLFMGTSAKINGDLSRLESIRRIGCQEINSKIPEKTNNAFKTFVLQQEKKNFDELDSAYTTNTICTKAYQVKKLEIQYHYLSSLFNTPGSLTTDYCNFITNENTNNPLAALSFDYMIYLNRLSTLTLLTEKNISGNNIDYAFELQRNGYVFTSREKEMINELIRIDSLDNTTERKEYMKLYYPKFKAFELKNKVILDRIKKETTKDDKQTIEAYFLKNGIKLTNEDKTTLGKREEYKSLKISKLYDDFDLEYKDDSRGLFWYKYLLLRGELIRENKLNELFGVQQGQCTDLMKCTSYISQIRADNSPLPDILISSLLERINNPFFAEHFKWKNQQMRMQIEANKKRTGYVINEVPKTDADKLFYAMMTKYKGKVVYVDFWATWCGPCRKGIEQIKPLKEEMIGKDVAFVYITNVSSPVKIWSDMITDIKGEHYRLSTDEWNVICSKFNITGIPHYVLVGKYGEVLNPNLNHMDNESLKNELDKRVKE